VCYDIAERLCRLLAAWWGRLDVEGLACVPADGPLLIVPNHDSQMDPIVVGVAVRPRRRVRFLARASLWSIPLLGFVLDGIGQIPIRRGSGDSAALDLALARLRSGDAIGVFPEGRLSWGVPVRARTGVGLLASWCPEARVVLCAVEGTTDFVRFPVRPRVRVRFFEPAGGQWVPGEDPSAFSARLLTELRALVPPAPAGRGAIVGGPPRIQRRLAANRPE
jgi:1-acyl-sn-glycerol-3-phosphate acyltransferase